MSGTTIYGSTAVCSPVGKFTSCIDAGSGTFSSTIGTAGDITITKASAASFIANNTSASGKSYRLVSTDSGTFVIQNTGIADLVTITSTGIATFASTICAPAAIFTGCVGIGTTLPCASLHVSPVASNSVVFPIIINNQANCPSAGYGVGLRLQNSSIAGGNENNKWAGIAAIAGGSSGYSNETDLAFYVGCFILASNCTCPPVEKMRIQSSTGNVGIGTTSPIRKLDIVTTGEQLRLAYDTSGTVYADFRNDSAGGLLINTSDSYIINYIGGTERMRILNNCSVIIQGSLGICRGGAINMTIPNGNNGGSIRMACCTGANEGDMFLTGGSGTGLLIAGSGKVGIGTTAPNEKLTVWTSSTTGLQTALRLNNPFGFANQNTGAQIIFSQDRSVAEDLQQGIIAVGQQDAGTSATSFMAFYTNNTGLGERLRISSEGVACFSRTICTPIAMIGSSCSPSAGINYLGQEGYRQKWLITQGRYRFCFGTEDFYGAIFIEMYGTNYNQGTSEVRVGKAVIPLRYGTSRSIIQVYEAGGVCVGAYRTNGIGLVWCNINGTVGDLIYTNAGSNQPDAVLATELHLLSNGSSLIGKFYRMCHTNILYDATNPYV